MGLDMYAYRTKEDIASVGFKPPEDATRFFYWRKHPNLHGWMEELYLCKGGEESFNCETVQLDEADLDELEEAVKGNLLPVTCGFFFGESRPENKADDLAFIALARQALAEGDNIFYDSWW